MYRKIIIALLASILTTTAVELGANKIIDFTRHSGNSERVVTDLSPGNKVVMWLNKPIILEWIGPEDALFEVESVHLHREHGFNAYKLNP